MTTSEEIKKYQSILTEGINWVPGVNTFKVTLVLSIADLSTPEEVSAWIQDTLEKNFQEEGEDVQVRSVKALNPKTP